MSGGVGLYFLGRVAFWIFSRQDQFHFKVNDLNGNDFEGHVAGPFETELANPVITAIMKIPSV